MTQEEREKFFEPGMLETAVKKEDWDKAFGASITPFNKNVTLGELAEYAGANRKTITVMIDATYMSVIESDMQEVNEDGES